MKFIAVDWSGALTAWRNKLWLAEAVDGRLVRLEQGRGRDEVTRHLIDLAADDPELVVGLDFAFSAPAWFLQHHGLASALELWDLASVKGEGWLTSRLEPFWGWPGSKRPELQAHFRESESTLEPTGGISAKSVFQIRGAGSVGTGSVRGWPYLAQLSRAGFSVWPFVEARYPVVMEIFPRLLTGPVVKTRRESREAYLDVRYPELDPEHRALMVGSDDAFDAGVSAIVSSRAFRFDDLESPLSQLARLEGAIWRPRSGTGKEFFEDAGS